MDDLGHIWTEEKLLSLILKLFWTSPDGDGQDTGAKAGLAHKRQDTDIIIVYK